MQGSRDLFKQKIQYGDCEKYKTRKARFVTFWFLDVFRRAEEIFPQIPKHSWTSPGDGVLFWIKLQTFFCQTLNSLNRFWANSFSISAVVDRNWKTHLYKCSVVPIRWAVFLNGQIIDILSRQGKECRGAWSSHSKPDCVGIFALTLVVQSVSYCRVVLRLKYFGIVAHSSYYSINGGKVDLISNQLPIPS